MSITTGSVQPIGRCGRHHEFLNGQFSREDVSTCDFIDGQAEALETSSALFYHCCGRLIDTGVNDCSSDSSFEIVRLGADESKIKKRTS